MASRSMKNRPSIKKKHPVIGVLVVFAILFALTATGGVGIYALGSSWLEDLPEYSDASLYNVARKTEVYANDGTTILAHFFAENREPVSLDQISPFVLEGTVATEDERFYEHDGVDYWGVARAVVVNLTGSSREGASTITQQFVRATVLSAEANDISFKRKVREMYISLELEKMYTKDEILLMYLNTINYGGGAYGIEAAAKTYFSKSASELTLIEAATLIGIPQSPTYNNPIDNPEKCLSRRNLVLERMLTNNYITQEEHDAALAEPLTLAPEDKAAANGSHLYPYFTDYIQKQLSTQFSEAEIFKGGMKVYTTIDPSIQLAAEEAARKQEEKMDEDIEVAMTALDPQTGYIKAMVGGKDFNADQYNLATQAKRSCGSAFKMFTLISAIENGISPSTNISCSSRVKIDEWNWEPENYGGAEYGTRSISSAFAVSSNTAFARLITYLTPEKVIDVARRLGVESDIDKVPAITLGGVGVSTDEMAGAIATVANGGMHHKVTGIERIVDRNGNTIFEADTTGQRALSPEVAHATAEVMKGVVTGGTGTSAALWSGQPVIGKTGTSDDWHDSYFIGSTPQISVAIWLGSRSDREMSSSYRAVNVFRGFVETVLEGQPIVQFPEADEPKYEKVSYKDLDIGTPTYRDVEKPKEDSSDPSKDEKKNNDADKGKKPDTGKDKPETPIESGEGVGGGGSGSGGDGGGGSEGGGGSGSGGGGGSSEGGGGEGGGGDGSGGGDESDDG